MDFRKIQELIKKREYIFSEHADEERTKDQLTWIYGKIRKRRML